MLAILLILLSARKDEQKYNPKRIGLLHNLKVMFTICVIDVFLHFLITKSQEYQPGDIILNIFKFFQAVILSVLSFLILGQHPLINLIKEINENQREFLVNIEISSQFLGSCMYFVIK